MINPIKASKYLRDAPSIVIGNDVDAIGTRIGPVTSNFDTISITLYYVSTIRDISISIT